MGGDGDIGKTRLGETKPKASEGPIMAKVADIFQQMMAILKDDEMYHYNGTAAPLLLDDDESREGDGDGEESESGSDSEVDSDEDDDDETMWRKTTKGGKRDKKVSGHERHGKHGSSPKHAHDTVDAITKGLERLQVTIVDAIKNSTTPPRTPSYTPTPRPAVATQARQIPPHQAEASTPNAPRKPFQCWTCGKTDHGYRDLDQCEAMRRFIDEGICSVTRTGNYLWRDTIIVRLLLNNLATKQ